MAYRCSCTARCRVCVGKDYIRLEFHGTHDETNHAEKGPRNSSTSKSLLSTRRWLLLPTYLLQNYTAICKMRFLKSMWNRICSDRFSSAFVRQEKSLPLGNYLSVEWCPSLLDSLLSGVNPCRSKFICSDTTIQGMSIVLIFTNHTCLAMLAMIHFNVSSPHCALNALHCMETG